MTVSMCFENRIDLDELNDFRVKSDSMIKARCQMNCSRGKNRVVGEGHKKKYLKIIFTDPQ